MSRLITDYSTHIFRHTLSRFITKFNHPLLTQHQIKTESANISFAFNSVPVFHRVKFTTPEPYCARALDSIVDSIHVQPPKVLKNGERVPARFDTAFHSFHISCVFLISFPGYCVAQVRVGFSIRPRDIPNLFPYGLAPPTHLAYGEWFSPFTAPEPDHLMYKVKRSIKDSDRIASVIPLANIRCSVHQCCG
ncbi:hypothetical protein C8F04DRAFT_966965 [Mycena alexandri]|uniref:Uncharacterized protein n=1 Tax=Mycena alexandri TaxID=1745969 RepID=A0AAD6SFD2_9AGAR|nr:hypothetical protein C8F04DRAFT_966965 [Mycena alexandri]